jgi:N-acetylmuramoyl-L-alanine amidase
MPLKAKNGGSSSKNPPKKATAKKQTQKAAPHKQKRKAQPSDDEESDDELEIIQRPTKKRSKHFQQEPEGEASGEASDGDVGVVIDAGRAGVDDMPEVKSVNETSQEH